MPDHRTTQSPTSTTPTLFRRSLVLTAIAELLTLAARFGLQTTAVEFNKGVPLPLQIHHMFWAIPLLILPSLTSLTPNTRNWTIATAISLIASDLLHHFAILPLLVGNTGWHWP